MDDDWLFLNEDVAVPVSNRHLAAYMANKAGYARGAARANVDDSEWRRLSVPHDASIEGAYDPSHHVNSGFLPRGVCWYRRHFRIEESQRGRSFQLAFDGVATHCQVFVNGHLLHRNFCGYTPFTVDFTEVAQYGDELNLVALRVDASYMEGWWYEGQGIYRPVWLIETGRVRIAEGGLFVAPERRASGRWTTRLETTLENRTDSPADACVRWTVRDPAGNPVGEAAASVTLPPRQTRLVNGELDVLAPALWSLETPSLYHLHARVEVDGQAVDDQAIRFGYRTLRFDADQGFFLNDRHVRLLGTCNHQDHGGLGVAIPESIQRFRIRQLKQMGCNAYRCAHHPPSKALLEICDELGMLVMDENRNFGSSPEHFRQLAAMVKRDRNHPSVVLWSICNEESIQGTLPAAEIAKAMVAEVKKLDPTRPVTAAISGGVLVEGGMAEVGEVLSLNYQLTQYEAFRAKFPNKCFLASETHCAHTTRGEYQTDASRHRFASYDDDHAPWGATARATWRALRDKPYVAGLFVWTGFDYRGEPSPHEWPSVTSHWGLLDLCGFEKDSFYLHRAWWTDAPFIHLLPHWNGPAGQTVRVRAYTNATEAELLLNGRSLGRRRVDPIEMVEWSVPFEPGLLEAIAYRAEKEVARTRQETTGRPAPAASGMGRIGVEVHASADPELRADGQCAVPLTLFARDAQGRRVPDANDLLHIQVDGAARLIGVANGDPTGHEHPKGPAIRLFNGKAQAIIQTTRTPGQVHIEIEGEEGIEARLTLDCKPAKPEPQVPAVQRRALITDWQMSRITADKPVLQATVDATDMNTFERISFGPAGQLQWQNASGYAQYRAKFSPSKRFQSRGGRLVFHRVLGRADVYLDDQRLLQSEGQPTLVIDLPAPVSPGMLNLILHSITSPAGIAGEVEMIAND